MKNLLRISGALAAVALLAPDMVTLGLYVGVVPGIALAVAPTVFLYALATTALRSVLPFEQGATFVSLLLAIAIGYALGAPLAAAGRKAFEAANTGDVLADSPVRIAGDVRLERNANVLNEMPRGGVWECDALCAALLDTPEVTSVTLAGTNREGAPIPALTFRLVPKTGSVSRGLAPRAPEQILMHVARDAKPADWKVEQSARESAKNELIAKWALRLASEKTLVADPAAASSDLVIVMMDVRASGFHWVAVAKLEISDANGTTLLRRQRVTASPVATPLFLWPQGPMMNERFKLGRTSVHSGPRYETIEPIKALFLQTTLAPPIGDARGVEEMRSRLAAAVSQPGIPDDLALVGPWVEALRWDRLSDADIDLLGALLSDARATGLDEIYSGYAKHVSPRLRAPIVTRLGDPSISAQFRYTLNALIRAMPAGTFATPTLEERSLLANQGLRLVSSSLVERLSDAGPSATPLLVRILEEDAKVYEWWKRAPVMDAVCAALTGLGPGAADALPVVERLLEMRNLIANDSGEMQAWRVAMVRMGRPVDELAFPSHFDAAEVAREREAIRTQADRAVQAGAQ
jgi:hypothetical protein